MEDRDTDEFILVLKGYFKLLMTMNLPIDREGDSLHLDSGERTKSIRYESKRLKFKKKDVCL